MYLSESSYLADLPQIVQYTRENLSYLADLLKFVQYTIVHLSTFLSGTLVAGMTTYRRDWQRWNK